MTPLFINRKLLQERMHAGLEAVLELPIVQKNKVAAIGFCFGGLAAIELFRSGAPIVRTVSFHAVLGKTIGQITAQTVALADKIPGALLMLHGHDDPLVTKDDIDAIEKEFSDANVDWQMHIYGNTKHAFTVVGANDPSMGLEYNSNADMRSWTAMKNFFKEAF
jgi:dienelactone hydrolase